MENLTQLKRERTQLRRMFTKASKQIDAILKVKESTRGDVLSAFKQLEDKANRLFEVDEPTNKLLLLQDDITESMLTEEFDEIELYRDEFLSIQTRCDLFLSNPSEETSKHHQEIDNASNTESTKRRMFRLPKLEFKKFDGNVRNWIGFWGQFRKIHDDEEIGAEDKLQYLTQAMEPGSMARELVESFPPSGANYAKALDQLKTRFARDEFLIEVYVRELLNLVLAQATNKSGMSLTTLFDKLETQLRALESMGVTRDKYAAMLYPLAESALPEEVLKVWERHRSHNKVSLSSECQESVTENYHSNTNLKLLLEFLRTEVESEERINLARSSFMHEKESRLPSRNVDKLRTAKSAIQVDKELYTAAALHASGGIHSATTSHTSGGISKRINSCSFCNKNHASQDCIKMQDISLEDRRELLKKNNCCFACLRPNHTLKKCKIFVKCLICKKKHYPILCPILHSKSEQEVIHKESNDPKIVENVLTSYTSTETLLQTLNVKIVNDNKSRIIRALLDSGSQRSYITTECAIEMNLPKLGEETIIQSVFGGKQSAPVIHNMYEVMIQNINNSFSYLCPVLDQSTICNYIPRLRDLSCIHLLREKNIFLSDVGPNPSKVSLLLGADIFGKIITGNIERLNNGLILIETLLGWVIMGQQETIGSQKMSSLICFNNVPITDLWNLDILGIRDPVETKTKEVIEAEVLKQFKETVTRNSEGRYEVCLSWVDGHPNLTSNRSIAENRLISTSKKLIALNKFEEYGKVFQEWLDLGIIEEVAEKDIKIIKHYLPHHAVIKESSATTKIRPVFDASAKVKSEFSLNDCLNNGPNMIELIPPLILKFRLGEIGVVADIKKAFLQISLAEDDRNFLAFIWWKNYQEKTKAFFRHCRVVFGVSISPFLLAATIDHHLDRAPLEFRETAEKLRKSFYVDNCITSVQNETELTKFMKEAKLLMTSGHFDLRGWVYNSGGVKDDDIIKDKDIASEGYLVSVLGMLWNIQEDTISSKIDHHIVFEEKQNTKRGLLSATQKFFDPIGFTCPTTMIPKLLLQETWKLKLGWDQELPNDIEKRFKSWINQIHWLKMCGIPRKVCHILDSKNDNNFSIHVFCDASKLAYATCIFLREDRHNDISVQLLQAKSRIAPMKQITLPRMELLAAVIGVRLCRSIKEVDELSRLKTFFWSDSMIVLTWIQKKLSLNTFISNRVKEIRSYSSASEWHHVPGDMNPADLPSRGCSPKALVESRWWEGPSWLKDKCEKWPEIQIVCSDDELNMEQKKTVASILVEHDDIFSRILNYFSKYIKIVRMIGWMIRFINNACKKNLNKGQLKAEEIVIAENVILKLIQREYFYKNLKDSKEKIIHGFTVLEDDNDILRVKTRLLYGDDADNFKYPILLPSKHELVKKLIEEQHLLHSHAGTQILLSILRERFWILRGRKTVRNVVMKCIRCRRFRQKAIETPFAPLPNNRIKSAAVFEVTGIDLAGPLYLKGKEKAWIIIFTCAIYRAVHFELVCSLSTDSFIMGLRRFIARRGRVKIIYSDNGRNFTGADNLFKKVNWDEISTSPSVKRIRWYFNPPTAAWWGGWWERIVRIVKELLRRTLGRASVYYEELSTLLCDCESTINSRPLTYISEDPDYLVPLTPFMFLQDTGCSDIPDLDNIDRKHLVKRFRYLQKLRENLRKRFRSEYLAELVNVGRRNSTDLKVGDIVLVGSDNAKRVDWPMGKISQIYPGRDNIYRVAKIKLQNSEVVRPFQRIFPLETSGEKNGAHQMNISRISRPLEDDEFRDRGKKGNENEPENIEDRRNRRDVMREEEQGEESIRTTSEIKTRAGRLVKPPERLQY